MSTLVAYFSRAGQNYGHGGIVNLAKGNTEILAEAIAADLGADLFKIETVEPYPADYYATTDVAKRELREKARPAIQGPLPSMEGVKKCIITKEAVVDGERPRLIFAQPDELTEEKALPAPKKSRASTKPSA
jgi:flavodoxin